MKRAVWIWIVAMVLCGCRDRSAFGDVVEFYGEDAVYLSGDSTLYLCRHEWRGIVLGEQNPEALLVSMPWRVPTKAEGVLLHKFSIDAETSQRYLCRDEDGVWWSFLFGSGNVTKAGMKTRYTLRPVRWQVAMRDTVINM